MSALVHSSTLVTAGVYIIIRFIHLFGSEFTFILLFLGSATMFLARFSALTETDIKKIIALSTLSQLGVIFISLSLQLQEVALFHLLVHAFFKALLFICGGNIIHISKGSQDIRGMG